MCPQSLELSLALVVAQRKSVLFLDLRFGKHGKLSTTLDTFYRGKLGFYEG